MSRETVFSNARLVLADEVIDGSVAVRDGLISSIDHGTAALPGAIDLGGDWLVPGMIELHTDNLEVHLKPRPTVNWPSLPAYFRTNLLPETLPIIESSLRAYLECHLTF